MAVERRLDRCLGDAVLAADQLDEHRVRRIASQRDRIIEPGNSGGRRIARLAARACGNAGNADFAADDVGEVGAVGRQKFQQAGANRTKSGDTEGEGFHGGDGY